MWGKPYAGIGRYTKEIVVYFLLNVKWKFTLLCYQYSYNELTKFKSEHNLKNVNLVLCKARLFSLKAQIELIRCIPACDILWIPHINVPLLPTKAHQQVTTIHDVLQLAHSEYYSVFRFAIIKMLIGRSIRKSKLVLTVSDFSVDEIVRFYGKKYRKKIRRIYNGFRSIDSERCPVQKKFQKYLLFVGSVKPHKNLKNALLAYELFLKSEHDFRFVIVGKREGFVTMDRDVDALVNRINQYDENVLFAGNVNDDELYSLYDNAKALVFPSLYEGFGIPLIEAMSFRLPIACSDIPVFHEICGDEVCYFNPFDIKSICRALENVCVLESKTYKEWQSWDETGRQILSELTKLL